MALSLASGMRAESVEASAKSCCFQSHIAFFIALLDLVSDSFSASMASISLCWFTDLTLSAKKDPTKHTLITVLLFAAFVTVLTTLFANSIFGSFWVRRRRRRRKKKEPPLDSVELKLENEVLIWVDIGHVVRARIAIVQLWMGLVYLNSAHTFS